MCGLGRIGEFVACKLKSMGVNVLGVVKSCNKKKYDFSTIQAEDLIHHLPKVDYLSIHLHLSLNDETFSIVDKSIFSHMSRKSVLINTARGKLVNEADLVNAIRKMMIHAAYLDTTFDEPISCLSPLQDCENIYITPHYACRSVKAVNYQIESICNILSKKIC